MNTFERIRAFLAEQLAIFEEEITMDSDLMEDFEADSLDLMDMIITLEDEFGLDEVPDEVVSSFHTVGDVVRYVEEHT